MYSALRDIKGVGSTRLHMDVAPALNILTHADSQGDAIWHIFARKDTDRLTTWMRKRYSTKGHPIHQQQFFLTDDDLADLWEELQIRPYTIHQHQNEIVLIPPGCPHQVGRTILYKVQDMHSTPFHLLCSRLATKPVASKLQMTSSSPTTLSIVYSSLMSFVRKILLTDHGW